MIGYRTSNDNIQYVRFTHTAIYFNRPMLVMQFNQVHVIAFDVLDVFLTVIQHKTDFLII